MGDGWTKAVLDFQHVRSEDTDGLWLSTIYGNFCG